MPSDAMETDAPVFLAHPDLPSVPFHLLFIHILYIYVIVLKCSTFVSSVSNLQNY